MTADRPGVADPATLLQSVHALLREIPTLVSDRVELLSLELERAGLALAGVLALVVGAAVVGVTAWMLLWAGVVVGLTQAGLAWPWSLLIALSINVGLAVLAVSRARRMARLLALPATRRHLTVSPSITAPPEAPAHVSPAH